MGDACHYEERVDRSYDALEADLKNHITTRVGEGQPVCWRSTSRC